jgi:formyltetrahydrofolate deformylase
VTTKRIVLCLSCPDAPGIVAEVVRFLFEAGQNIVESAQFFDRGTGRFFMRVVAEPVDAPAVDLDALRAGFVPLSARRGMDWTMRDPDRRLRVLVLVSRFDHCLNDLLYRYGIGGLPVEIPAVVSNHSDCYRQVAAMGIPYHHMPGHARQQGDPGAQAPGAGRGAGDRPDRARPLHAGPLPRPLRPLRRPHHQHPPLLPALVQGCQALPPGPRPRREADRRHRPLRHPRPRRGPIIEQDVARVDHAMSPDDLVALGRDVENVVLARAVRWHAEHRVMPNGQKTVVFR